MDSTDYEALKRENERRVLAAEFAGEGTVDAWPIHIVFEFTGACNLHCFMCGFEHLRDELRAKGRTNFTLPIEIFREAARRTFPYIRTVNPTVAGEPMVLPYFDELVDAVDHYGCKLALYSNGMLLRGERLRKLMPQLASMTISFDGATKKTFEYVRTGGNFEQVMENVAEFSKMREELGLKDQIQFDFNVTLLRENVEELPQIIEIAAQNGVDALTAGYVIVTSEAVRASSPLNCPEVTNRAIEAAATRAAELGLEVRLPDPVPLDAASKITVAGHADVHDLVPFGEAAELEASAQTPAQTPAQAPAQTPAQAPAQTPPEPVDATPPESTDATDKPNPTDKPDLIAPAPAAATSCSAKTAETAPGPSPEPTRRVLGQRPAKWQGKYYCNMPWRQVFIGLGGEMFPCCAPGRPILGNALEQDFFEIWNGEEYRRLREGLYNGDLTDYCRVCPYLQEAGSTPFDAEGYMSIDGDPSASPKPEGDGRSGAR